MNRIRDKKKLTRKKKNSKIAFYINYNKLYSYEKRKHQTEKEIYVGWEVLTLEHGGNYYLLVRSIYAINIAKNREMNRIKRIKFKARE